MSALRHRPSQMEPLTPSTFQRLEDGELTLLFDSLSGHRKLEGVGHGDDRSHQGEESSESVPSPSTNVRSTFTASTGKRFR